MYLETLKYCLLWISPMKVVPKWSVNWKLWWIEMNRWCILFWKLQNGLMIVYIFGKVSWKLSANSVCFYVINPTKNSILLRLPISHQIDVKDMQNVLYLLHTTQIIDHISLYLLYTTQIIDHVSLPSIAKTTF